MAADRKHPRRELARRLAGIASTAAASTLFAGIPTPVGGSTEVRGIMERVQAVRAKVEELQEAASPAATTAVQPTWLRLAQWYNWPNWSNGWGNWQNWRNW